MVAYVTLTHGVVVQVHLAAPGAVSKLTCRWLWDKSQQNPLERARNAKYRGGSFIIIRCAEKLIKKYVHQR